MRYFLNFWRNAATSRDLIVFCDKMHKYSVERYGIHHASYLDENINSLRRGYNAMWALKYYKRSQLWQNRRFYEEHPYIPTN